MAAEAVKSAKRTLEILELLTKCEAMLTFSQIEAVSGIPRSSLHGLLATLVDSGWLEYHRQERGYSLGIRTLEAGNVYLRALDVVERARPHMEEIRDAMDETVQLSMLDGRFNVYVGKVDGRQALSLASAVGRRLPAHATGVGKVLLADLSPATLERVVGSISLERFTAHTIVDYGDLVERLGIIRRCGYGTDEEEYTVGVRCVAVPVHDHSGRVVAAMSVSIPTIRFERVRFDQALELLVSAAGSLSTTLGYCETVGRWPTRPAV